MNPGTSPPAPLISRANPGSPSSSSSSLSDPPEKLTNLDEDPESGVGHSSSDEDYYSSVDESRELSSTYVLNESFKIHVSEREQWLCLARLPRDLEEDEFLGLCSEFGAIKHHHLIRSESTSKFKGYGLVEYVAKSSSIQAKHILDGHQIRGHTLEADWLTPDRIHETSLHSKCLFVDRLPPDYRDMGEFRKLFSSITNPPYCQIAMKNGVIQSWGLVEFQRSRDAEETLRTMDGHEILPGSKIRVQYCIPGVHAIHVYMSFVNNPLDTLSERKALLEETPSTKVYDQLESLSKQNPWFVQSLQNIMAMNNNNNNSNGGSCGGGGSSSEAFIKDAKPSMSAKGDPAQAALVLLLASYVIKGKESSNKSTSDSTACLLQGVIKKLEAGISAADILKTFLPSSSESDLRSFISGLLVKNDYSSHKGHSPPSSSSLPCVHSQQQTKDPTLTDLLLQSFQASLNKGKGPQQSTPPHSTMVRGTAKNPVLISKSLLHQPANKPPSYSGSPAYSSSPSALNAVYPQLPAYRPSTGNPPATTQHPHLFNSFYPGLWPSQMSFPLIPTPAAHHWSLPLLNTTLEGTPYLTGALAYPQPQPTAAPAVAKRKIESTAHHHHLYGNALSKKVKLNEGV